MNTTPQRARMTATGLLAVSFLLAPRVTPATGDDRPGRVLYNPTMPDCWREVPWTSEDRAHPTGRWKPTPAAAANVVVRVPTASRRRTGRAITRSTVPSGTPPSMFLYIGHDRLEVRGRGTRGREREILTRRSLPVVERLLGLIMPRIQAGEHPDIDRLATDARVNRETARDILWLVLGNRPMALQHTAANSSRTTRFSDRSLRPDRGEAGDETHHGDQTESSVLGSVAFRRYGRSAPNAIVTRLLAAVSASFVSSGWLRLDRCRARSQQDQSGNAAGAAGAGVATARAAAHRIDRYRALRQRATSMSAAIRLSGPAMGRTRSRRKPPSENINRWPEMYALGGSTRIMD